MLTLEDSVREEGAFLCQLLTYKVECLVQKLFVDFYNDGNTPLHLAAHNRDLEMFKVRLL